VAGIKTTKTAKDAAPVPAPFQEGMFDESGIGAGPWTPYFFLVDASGNIISTAQDGTDATGATPLPGGAGIRGYLSSIFTSRSNKDLTATAAAPGTIAGSGNWLSALMTVRSHKNISVGVSSTQAGAINIQRYVDAAGLVAQGAVVTQAIAANTPKVLNVMDGLPFQSFTVQITNSSGSTATLSNFALLLQPAG
jgi:hypothetical protein